jgi:hypothetical protein
MQQAARELEILSTRCEKLDFVGKLVIFCDALDEKLDDLWVQLASLERQFVDLASRGVILAV